MTNKQKAAALQVVSNEAADEYITPFLLHETIERAGRLVGVGDFRPTYGRYQINNFRVGE